MRTDVIIASTTFHRILMQEVKTVEDVRNMFHRQICS